MSDIDRMPSFEDFLICQSTVPGMVANRDLHRGTWYMYSLCQELAESAHDTEITGILKRVCHNDLDNSTRIEIFIRMSCFLGGKAHA